MSDDNAKTETDKKPEKTSQIPDAALDKATGGVELEENVGKYDEALRERRIE